MVKIAICDDNERELEQTYSYVKRYQEAKIGWDFFVEKFDNGFNLLESVEKTGGYDIYILDIVMPNINGIQLGEEINKRDNSAQIILLTTSPEFGVESYSIFARDYILKPCDPEKLIASIDRIVGNMQTEKPKYFSVNVTDGVHVLPYHKILYIEYYRHRLICHLTDGETVESKNMRQPFFALTDELLKEGSFLRISASYVINMQYVKKFTSREFEMINNEKIPLSRLYADARETYMDYIFDKKSNKKYFE